MIKPLRLRPARLRPGDAVGIVSPAGPVRSAELLDCQRFLEEKGFRVRMAPHAHDRRDYLAGSDNDRLEDLEEMFLDDDIKAIFCSRGGYGSLRLLDRIDYELIGNHPKIFVGYSDITALLTAIFKQTGLITFHGPMGKEFSGLPERIWEHLFQMISSERPLSIDPMEGYPLSRGRATGPIMGGNLSLLCQLLGTPYMPDLDGCLLFIEDRGEALYRIDRMLTHLRLSGCLKGIKGLLTGSFLGCGDAPAIENLIKENFTPMNIPIVAGFPLGHGPRNITLPLGMPAELDTHAMKLSLWESNVV